MLNDGLRPSQRVIFEMPGLFSAECAARRFCAILSGQKNEVTVYFTKKTGQKKVYRFWLKRAKNINEE